MGASLPQQRIFKDGKAIALSFIENLASYLSGVFWPPPTWLPSNACMPKRATKDDEETQSDADTLDSQDGESPTPIELDPVFMEQIFEAPSTFATRGSISRARERLTRMEILLSVMSELEVAEPITEMYFTSTTCARVRRTSALNELEHAAEEVPHLKTLTRETKCRHHVSRNYIISQSNKSDNSIVKFKGLDVRSNLLKTLQNI
ncbi:uncharacterized protein LOC110697575 isoform X2 [Chenopodium quinoa]|uniref:uncharacterized protein LOC110697575 isoform X2 n=1 Tax=Chenopodium quinoa TaxID=63459 RepID=UPI000B7917FD|nr:uncharacterized protein LOC110697575 isoform X2 [Chenopodium quinoa]